MLNTNHVTWHSGYLLKEDRNRLNRHGSGAVWFTGLSASGKSTIANGLERMLFQEGIRTYVLDGDNIRHGLNSNLGFSKEDRDENIRRIAEVSRLFVDAGIIVLAAFITPFKEQRIFIRGRFDCMNFIEVFVKCDIEECIRRDPKGSYQKARMGIIKNYTGISSPFEEPENPDITINTQILNIEESVSTLYAYLREKNFWLSTD